MRSNFVDSYKMIFWYRNMNEVTNRGMTNSCLWCDNYFIFGRQFVILTICRFYTNICQNIDLDETYIYMTNSDTSRRKDSNWFTRTLPVLFRWWKIIGYTHCWMLWFVFHLYYPVDQMKIIYLHHASFCNGEHCFYS